MEHPEKAFQEIAIAGVRLLSRRKKSFRASNLYHSDLVVVVVLDGVEAVRRRRDLAVAGTRLL